MTKKPELIVMLTHEDKTVHNAHEIFDACRHSKANYWGFKEEPLPLENMKALYKEMKSAGKTTFLEVVAYTEEEGYQGALDAIECDVDILMGTIYSDKINALCQEHGLKYMPFVGTITDRPSVLEGEIDDIIKEAKTYLEKGVYGFDLLGYRYTGDPLELNNKFVEAIDAPVVIAGSVNSYQRLDELKDIQPWAYTIGSAFFDNDFDGEFHEQIDKVVDYMNK